MIERPFQKIFKNEGTRYLACNDKKAFFTSTEGINFGLVRMYVTPYRFFWKIFTSDLVISYTDKFLVFRLCAPLVADLFLFCYERDFLTSLSDDNPADITEAFNSTSRYLDDLLNIDNPYFEGMVNQIYPPELQLNKANTSDTEAPLLDLHLSVSYGFVSCKIYDKRDEFDFDIVNFPFFAWRCSTSFLLWSDYFSTY